MADGYEKMSARGRAVCEFVELATRLDIQKLRKGLLPVFPPLSALEEDLLKRYLNLTEAEKAAVIDLRGRLQPMGGGRRPSWEHWLNVHIMSNPNDAPDLLLLQKHFGGSDRSGSADVPLYILDKFGVRNYPWKMNHPW